MFQIKIAEKVRTHSFSLSLSLMRQCGIIFYSQTGHRWLYGVCKLPAG